ncbi:cell division protein FtsK [Candidatus Kaiserbacteria bacterium CG10_big_fil_rev_8_21_14_0_10_45_20]|uniref:Cell division protein FtsK n=1 Tax=Candidatus Kaiserbacteria bacterium CG10_big_fil_rev_8_21_14_0_10_45_20 TaxID=1974607 RepID=A0A2H0UGS3_9BACT|nr:MAG: cell division protein FtsK [Candidatus Kaiserbacteria bacterium CG10_big_fil_rev_8_21_14_0_10_45_20]
MEKIHCERGVQKRKTKWYHTVDMAKRRRRRKSKGSGFALPSLSMNVRAETVRSIYAIGASIAALLFLVAPTGLGGTVGSTLYEWFTYLFGFGYFLLPLSLIFLVIGLVKVHEDEGVGVTRIVGALLLFVSGIGILSLAGDVGGFLGTLVAYPFVSLFETVFGSIALGAIAIVGTLIALDTPLKIPSFSFGRTSEKDPAEEVSDEEEYEEEDEYEEEEEEEEPEPKKEKKGLFGKKEEEDEEELPQMAFSQKDTAYVPPPISLLEKDKGKATGGDVKANANLIKRTLANFGIQVEMDEISIGPSVTRYALKPAEGVRLQKILALQNNLELALAASPVRIEAPIPGKSLVGIEVPNSKKSTVGLATLLADTAFTGDTKPLTVALGKDITGNAHFANIAKMPHLLIAGATGSGKSVSIHALITSLLYRNGPDALRLIMVDPKRVELTLYNKIPHLLAPVITDPKKAILALKWAAKEMDRRYNLLEENSVRDILSYHTNVLGKDKKKSDDENGATPDRMPYIVIVVDELADIMQSYPREMEAAVVRLAQMSRAVGIHLVLSTQRPSVNVITGLIKANIPARVALQVASQIDSRTILDGSGAEKLLGAGDMLYLSGEMSKPHRIQTAFISEDEVKKVVAFIHDNNDENLDEITLSGSPAPDSPNAIFSASLEDDNVDDDLYGEAKQTVEDAGKASTSFLQRKLRVGYARAARLMDILEEKGVIGPADGARPRDVLTLEDAPDNDEHGEEEGNDTEEEDTGEKRN